MARRENKSGPTLPKESISRSIGEDAKLTFYKLQPRDWRVTPLSGDEDVGYDFQIQDARTGKFTYTFRMQLKGSGRPSKNAEGDAFAETLKSTTLNYYRNTDEPILLVFCDLSVESDPRDCPAYFVWVHDEIKRLIKEKDFSNSSQKTHTIYVPLSNKFSPAFDVAPYYDQHLAKVRATDELYETIASTTRTSSLSEPVKAVERISTKLQQGGPPLLNYLIEESATPWPEAPDGSIARRLSDANTAIQHGDDVNARSILLRIEDLSEEPNIHELAELHFLHAKVEELRGNSQEARRRYRKANHTISDQPRYLAARVEHAISSHYRGCSLARYRKLLDLVPGDGSREVAYLRAKILAILGNVDAALEELDCLVPSRRHFAEALTYAINKKWSKVNIVIKRGLKDPDLPDKQKVILHLLSARAHFSLSIQNVISLDKPTAIPLTGIPGMDFKVLNKCWDEIVLAMRHAKLQGWPKDLETIADIIPIVAITLNRYETISYELTELAEKRPHLAGIQEALERISIFRGDFSTAIAALERQPRTEERLLREIILLVEAKRFTEVLSRCVAIRNKKEFQLHLNAVVLALGAIAANRLGESNLEQKLVSELDLLRSAEGEKAVYQYFATIQTSPLAKADAIAELLSSFRKWPDCEFLYGVLMGQLDPRDEFQARALIEVSKRVYRNRELDFDSLLGTAQAYHTIGDYDALVELSDDAVFRFGEIGKLLAIKAVALEGLGRAQEALSLLERLLSEPSQDSIAVHTYINLSIRCGRTNEAIVQIEQLLSQTSKLPFRKQLTRLLFLLHSRTPTNPQKTFEIAWRFGQLVDQKVEEEEGPFLAMFLTSTINPGVKVAPDQVDQFEDRVTQFETRFPESKLFRRIPAPDPENPEAFLSKLRKIAGLSDEKLRAIEKLTRQVRRGELPVPFVFRPHQIFINVGDVFHLWELSKSSSRDAGEFHLTLRLHDERDPVNLTSEPKVILFDLLSLILLLDLDLLELTIHTLGKFAVSKETLLILQDYATPLFSGVSEGKAKKIVEILQSNFRDIEQPGRIQSRRTATKDIFQAEYEELRDLVSSGKYVLYSDDAFYRAILLHETGEENSYSASDLIESLDQSDAITAAKAGQLVSRLAGWNIGGVFVSSRHFFAAIPDAISSATTPLECEECLLTNEAYSGLINALWDVKAPYKQTLSHICGQLAYLAKQENVKEEIGVGIWRTWMHKVRVRTDVSFNIFGHITQSMVGTMLRLDVNEKQGLRWLWNCCRKMLELEHGDRMSEQLEREGIGAVAVAAAKVAKRLSATKDRESLWEKMKAGFIEGTADFDALRHEYQRELQKIESKTD